MGGIDVQHGAGMAFGQVVLVIQVSSLDRLFIKYFCSIIFYSHDIYSLEELRTVKVRSVGLMLLENKYAAKSDFLKGRRTP